MNDKQNPDKGARKRVLTITVTNEPNVLVKILGLISGKGLNISGTTVFESEDKATAIITIVFMSVDDFGEHLKLKIETLQRVHSVRDLTDEEYDEQALILVKVSTNDVEHPYLIAGPAQTKHHARFENQMTCREDCFVRLSMHGTPEKCHAFIEDMRSFGNVEVSGSGPVIQLA